MRLLSSLESIEMWAQAKVSLSSITWYMTLSKLLIPLNHHVKDEDKQHLSHWVSVGIKGKKSLA